MNELLTTAARLVPRHELGLEETAAMHRLLSNHFDGVTIEQFHRDLAEKNWVILIERQGRLVGFSTLCAYETTAAGELLSVVYSGDTIVAPEAWNSSALPRGWIESVAGLRRHYPRGRYLWMLITSGFRTYRFLPVFWREFYPRCDAATPPDHQRIMGALARERFGKQYDAETGIVHLSHAQRLKDELAAIPVGRSDDLHVAFFALKNPGYRQGDELLCVTELSPENLTSAGRRMAAAVPRW